MKTEVKTWQDKTIGISKIEGLNFDGDRYWEECTITIHGRGEGPWPLKATAQSFTIYLNGERIFSEVVFGKKVIKKTINSYNGFNITGDMAHQVVALTHRADGSVTVECTYNESSVLKSKSVSWKDTGAVTIMQNLFLDASETWKRCQVKIEGAKFDPGHINVNRFRMQLITDGSLAQEKPYESILGGTESRLYSYNVNGKVTLLVSGYFNVGGAKVTLTGFY
ncbi:hypothetical protein SAMN05444266_109246 [Chitinophaga jiangningensis]|uniref:Uncharacterized protein n=1 Tax=Chitinophaga jiangningensis TaxID=1419482 RepID=A0A1M7KDE9_9BACT|nr:hypothetical protein [Chitinophaga jiangningensis]SHM62849.1 hypothetical protein SAMN05444266_109246 [Chitinophaga jiangningensis]